MQNLLLVLFSIVNVTFPLHAYPMALSVIVAISFAFGHLGFVSYNKKLMSQFACQVCRQ